MKIPIILLGIILFLMYPFISFQYLWLEEAKIIYLIFSIFVMVVGFTK